MLATDLNSFNHIHTNHLSEWEDSGVDREITVNAIQSHKDGREVDELLSRNTKRRWKHSKHLVPGWSVRGVDPHTGEPTLLGVQYKPDNPPVGDDGKARKYLGASGYEAVPLFLDTGEPDYWKRVLENPSIPVIITEGAKKAGCGLSNGVATISLPGVNCGLKEGQLKPQLEAFCQAGRSIYLAFDSDIIQKWQVRHALKRLGERLNAQKTLSVYVMQWSQEDGKGLDDYLCQFTAEQRPKHLQRLMQTAIPFTKWVRKTKMSKTEKFVYIQQLWGHRTRLNVRSRAIEIDGNPTRTEHFYLELLNDHIDCTKSLGCDAIEWLAHQNEYDPVKDYLESIRGGRKVNIDHLAAQYFGVHKKNPLLPLYNSYLKGWLIAAVKRVYEPGCKFDNALILKGKQGIGKSLSLRTLGGEFFTDTVHDCRDKDHILALHRHWICEIAEIECAIAGKRASGEVKDFFSKQVDVVRAPYARKHEALPRRTVVAGTTNEDEFLQDATGNRRFWVIPVGQINLKKLRQNRDAIWAAAIEAYEAGEDCDLTLAEQELQNEANKEYEISDPWDARVEEYAQHREEVSNAEILTKCLKLDTIQQTRREQMRVSRIFQRLGWESVRAYFNGIRQRCYRPPTPWTPEPAT
ncbi:VapE domain-containing protein [Baaleninema sp.]|uniref:VapE domain-containing protein n=1 Tax=Baaleninema sp. TaxID=3101197 RepID=UPI003D010519